MKIKKIVTWLVIIVFTGILVIFISSNYTPSDEIKFGYMECLKLDSGEYQVKPIDSISLEEYGKYSFYDSTELWLNRVLSGKNKTYIGMSTRLAPQEYIALMKKDSSANIFLSREYSNDKKLYYAFFLKKSDRFIYRTLYSEPKQGDMLLFDITNKDSLAISKLYIDKQYLIIKLNCD